MAWVEGRYARRSVARNVRRTALSVLGIGVGCALAVTMESVNLGREELFARAGAFGGVGHVKVVPAGWRGRRDPRLRLADPAAALAAARALPGVAAVTARARAEVLLAMGNHVLPVELAGVDPVNEPRAFRLVRQVASGRWLSASDRGAVVLGRAAADRLSAGLGDEILVTAVAAGGRIEGAMLRIVGLVETGSEDVDAGLAHVVLADLEGLTGLRGPGEVAIVLRDYRAAPDARAAVAAALRGGDEALLWSEVAPDFAGHMKQDEAASRVVSRILVLIAVLGVAAAQLAAVLERRREFAVLAALGMRAGRMARLVLLEALGLGLAGAALALALAAPLLWKLHVDGLDFRRFMGTGPAFQGVLMEPILYGDLGPWVVPWTLGIALGATMLASLYPAWFAARTDPATALRVAP